MEKTYTSLEEFTTATLDALGIPKKAFCERANISYQVFNGWIRGDMNMTDANRAKIERLITILADAAYRIDELEIFIG